MLLPSDITFRHLRFDPDHLAGWRAMLSDEEEERVRGFTQEKRIREFILGRAAARLLLSERLGIHPGVVPLEVAESGAVTVAESPVSVSIAHSGDHAVAAAASRGVGVDIESIAPRHASLHRYLLHPDEHDLLDSVPLDPDRAQILVWTLKEATLKAMGTGLRFSPKKLRLHVDFAAERAVVEVEGGGRWSACFEQWDNYYVALAFSE